MEAPITLGDSAIDRRKFISVLALVNNGGVQSKAYSASHPAASPETCRANSPAYFRDLGVKEEYLAQLEKKLDLEDLDIQEKVHELVLDSRTPASVKLKCWELIAKLKGDLVERREHLNKNQPNEPEFSKEEMAEITAKADMIMDSKWEKKESELSELQRENQDLISRFDKQRRDNEAMKKLLDDLPIESKDNDILANIKY